MDEEQNANLTDRELLILDRKRRANLFNGLTFLIKRECPREAMVFIVKSFGGEVCWEGEGSPIDINEEEDKITRSWTDRCRTKKNVRSGKSLAEFIVPQWICDCANSPEARFDEQLFEKLEMKRPVVFAPGMSMSYVVPLMKVQPSALGGGPRAEIKASASTENAEKRRKDRALRNLKTTLERNRRNERCSYSKALEEREARL